MPRSPDVHHSKIPTRQHTSPLERTHRQLSSVGRIPKIPIQRQTAFIITISSIAMEQAEVAVLSEMEIIIICSTTIATATFQYQIINIKWISPRTKWSSWWTIWIAQMLHRRLSIIATATCKSSAMAMDSARNLYRKHHCWARWDVIDWMEVLMARAAINYRLMMMPEQAIRRFSWSQSLMAAGNQFHRHPYSQHRRRRRQAITIVQIISSSIHRHDIIPCNCH